MASEPETKVLCSSCFDVLDCARVIDIVARATCARCGRLCLGYVTEVPNGHQGLDSTARVGVE